MDIKILIKRLEKYGLKKFVTNPNYIHHLYNETIELKSLGLYCGVNEVELNGILNAATNFEKVQGLYNRLGKRIECETFLNALNSSNNQEILEYINEKLPPLSETVPANQSNAVPFQNLSPEPIVSHRPPDPKIVASDMGIRLKNLGLSTEIVLQKKFDQLCTKTANHSRLCNHLYSAGVLEETTMQTIAKQIPYEQAASVYRVMSQIGCFEKLIEALLNSGNGHIVELIEEILNSYH